MKNKLFQDIYFKSNYINSKEGKSSENQQKNKNIIISLYLSILIITIILLFNIKGKSINIISLLFD